MLIAGVPEVSSDCNEGEGIQDQCSRARRKTLMVERAGDGWSSENGHATRTRTPDRRYQPGRYTGGGVFGGISHFKITDSIYRIGISHPSAPMSFAALHTLQTVLAQVFGAVRTGDLAPPCERDDEGGGVVVTAHLFCKGKNTLRSMLRRDCAAGKV